MAYRKRDLVLIHVLIFSGVAVAGIKDIPVFLVNAFKKPNVVGAILPCAAGVGKELTRYMISGQKENQDSPLHILEVGGGTGEMTEVIVAHLRAIDHLDVVEIVPEFCERLHEQFDKYPNVTIHCMSIIDWQPGYKYDFVISTLPFNSFEYDLMDSIIDHLGVLIKPSGILSYVAYAGIAEIKKPFLWGKKRADHKKKMKRLKQWRSHYLIAKKTIIKNVPPINIYHMKIVS